MRQTSRLGTVFLSSFNPTLAKSIALNVCIVKWENPGRKNFAAQLLPHSSGRGPHPHLRGDGLHGCPGSHKRAPLIPSGSFQSVLQATARVIFSRCKSDHVLPISPSMNPHCSWNQDKISLTWTSSSPMWLPPCSLFRLRIARRMAGPLNLAPPSAYTLPPSSFLFD